MTCLRITENSGPGLTIRDRVDAFAALGVVLYMDAGQLRAKGPAVLVDAARPAIHLHKAELLNYLDTLNRAYIPHIAETFPLNFVGVTIGRCRRTAARP